MMSAFSYTMHGIDLYIPSTIANIKRKHRKTCFCMPAMPLTLYTFKQNELSFRTFLTCGLPRCSPELPYIYR